MKTKHYTTKFHFTARIKAWILKRWGYSTNITRSPCRMPNKGEFVVKIYFDTGYDIHALKLTKEEEIKFRKTVESYNLTYDKRHIKEFCDGLLAMKESMDQVPDYVKKGHESGRKELKIVDDALRSWVDERFPNPWKEEDLEDTNGDG